MNTCKPKFREARRGFTLIEVLVVVSIIVILAAIGLAVGLQVKRSAADHATKETLDALDGAMILFLKEHPEPTDATWLNALQASNMLPGSIKSSGGPVLDGYGNAIHYEPSNPPAKPTGFFHSYGIDGTANTDDDVYSKGTSAK
jgi:prepilin-type N-terminal cleavage/methylation domain-containing protein